MATAYDENEGVSAAKKPRPSHVHFTPVSVSAPSKLILHGEHAVVYGKTAVTGTLNLRTRMLISPGGERSDGDPEIRLDFPDVNIKQSWTCQEVKRAIFEKFDSVSTDMSEESRKNLLAGISDFLQLEKNNLQKASLLCFFYLYRLICESPIPLTIKVESQIPIGAGLGSSAALSVCLAAGLVNIKGQLAGGKADDDLNLKKVCRLAFLSEVILHGTPSGVDNSASTYGGMIRFSEGKMKCIDKVPKLKVLLVNTNVPKNTSEQVGKVAEQCLQHPDIIKPVFDAIDGVSKTCLSLLEEIAEQGPSEARYDSLQSLLGYNHNLLKTLGVSHPALDEIVQICHSHGFQAKLTGSGGGGFAFALLAPSAKEGDVSKVKDRLTKRGFQWWQTELGVEGVKIEPK